MPDPNRPRSPGRAGLPHDINSTSWWPLPPGHERSWAQIWAHTQCLGPLRSWEELNGRKPPVHHQRPPPTLEIDSPAIRTSWIIPSDDDCRGFDDDDLSEPEAPKPSAPPPAAEAPEPPAPPPPPVKKPRKSVISPEKLAEIARRVRAGHATIRQRAAMLRPVKGRWSNAA